jgi:hypothetical protein
VQWDPGPMGFTAGQGGSGEIGEQGTGVTAPVTASFSTGTWQFTLQNATFC